MRSYAIDMQIKIRDRKFTIFFDTVCLEDPDDSKQGIINDIFGVCFIRVFSQLIPIMNHNMYRDQLATCP